MRSRGGPEEELWRRIRGGPGQVQKRARRRGPEESSEESGGESEEIPMRCRVELEESQRRSGEGLEKVLLVHAHPVVSPGAKQQVQWMKG